ncbi:MAG: hypothetical protein ACM3N0_08875 [Chloroflexota bacterium]
MTTRAELASVYARIGQTYLRWAPSLLLLAVVVFVPLGLIHALTVEAHIGSLDLGGGLKPLALGAAVFALAATGLVGEVFYTGTVAISLTHPHDGRPPSLLEVARMIGYGPLIAIDLIYGALVAAGLALFVVPGVLTFVWLGLAAPVIEIERDGFRTAFPRSVQLVRGRFLLVAAVLIPIELLGDGLTDLATALTHNLVGSELLCDWLADVLANVAFTPFYAVAAVLLTVDLIREKGGGAKLNSGPTS